MNWKDESSWSRSDTTEQRAAVETWAVRTTSVLFIVTRHRDFPPDSWVISAEPFFKHVEVTGNVSADEAKAICEAKALKLIDRLRAMVVAP